MTALQRRASIAVVLAVATFLVIVGFGIGGEPFVGNVDNGAEVLAAFLATAACFGAARRSLDASRRSWLLLGAGTLSWGLGQLIWTWYESVVHEAPFPSAADVGFLLSIPLIAAAMLTFPSNVRTSGRVRALLDGLTIACACLGVSWILVMDRVAADAASGTDLVLALAYPAGDVVILVVALTVLSRSLAAYRPTVMTLTVALCLLALADSAFAYLSTTDTVATSPFNVGWFAGFLVLALAARWGRTTAVDVTATEVQPAWVMMLPYVPMAVFVLLAVPTQIRHGHLGGVFTWVGVPLVLLLLVRQVIVYRENSALTQRLEQQIVALASSREHLRLQALHDPLTGLPNRTHLMRELAGRFDTNHPPQSALLLMDLDRFKEINDGLGHDVGDRVLREVAQRLHAATPSGDTVVRLGGDEFALLLDDPPGEKRPEAVARQLLAALANPVEVDGLNLSVGVSIGICHSTDVDRAAALLQSADVAMYRAKRLATSIAVFGPEDDEDRPGRLVLLNDLRDALDHGQLQVAYQPQVDLSSGRVVAMEALARWHHPERGWIPPDEFIPVAEQTGLIRQVTQQVLTTALAQCAAWRAMGLDLSISVNLSPRALQDPRLGRDLHAIILNSRLPSRFLTLEITEGAFAGNLDSLVTTLERLRTLGARLSIDDFGTGYSSMAHLKRMPVEELKIDREFVTGMADDRDDQAIVASIVALARTLRLSVVAEGVEDAESLALVRSLGCDVAQGYYVHRPADAASITEWMTGLGRTHSDPSPTPHAARTTEATVAQ